MSSILKPKVIIPVVVVIAAGVVGYFVWQNNHQQPNSQNDASKSSINYGPATDAEKNPAGVNNAKNGGEPTSNSDQDNQVKPGKKKTVSVTITTWAQKHGDMAINGYVDGVVESGGTCTLTLTKGDVSRTATRPAQPNATNTTCGENDIPISSLSPGTWQATLSYSSDTSSGASNKLPVEVTNE